MSREEPRPAALSRSSAGWFSTPECGTFQTLFLGIIAGVMAFAAPDAASLIAIPTVLALLCAIALAPSVRWLERTGAPASLCAAVVVGLPRPQRRAHRSARAGLPRSAGRSR